MSQHDPALEIAALLNCYHSATLWEMANAAGLEVSDRGGKRLPKTEVVRRMRAEFFGRDRILASLSRLDKRERAILDRLLMRGGTSPTSSLRRELIRARLVTGAPEKPPRDAYYTTRALYADGYSGHPLRPNSRIFEDVLARLTLHGLVFSQGAPLTTGGTPYKLQYHPGRTLIIPPQVRQHLPQPGPIPPDEPGLQPAQVQEGDPGLLLRDLYLYWSFVRHSEVALLQSGLVGKRSLKAINQILLQPDAQFEQANREDEAPRLFLLAKLLERLGLAARTRGQLVLTQLDPLDIPDFWSWPRARQLRACLLAWCEAGPIDPWEREASRYRPLRASASRLLLSTLAGIAADTWFEPQDLLDRLLDQDRNFLFADRGSLEDYRGGWYYSTLGGDYYGAPREILARLQRYELAFVRAAVEGILFQLGVVDLGYDGASWDLFRLTTAGKAALQEEEETETAGSKDHDAEGKLVIQPNFQILAIGPISLDRLARLDLFAERQTADRAAFEYRLTKDSIYRAQRLGMEVPEVIRFLEEVSGVELAQNVRRSLDEWDAHHQRIVFRSGVTLMQAASEDMVTALMAQPQIQVLLERRLSPVVAEVRPGSTGRLVSSLVGQGRFPAVSGIGSETLAQSVTITPDGTVRPVHAVPTLHLCSLLDKLAEKTSDREWCLTEKSVRRAATGKNQIIRLLDQLAWLSRGPFPAALKEQIKAWGRYYGSAAVEALTLIEFRDADTLAELSAQPELHTLLAPFPAGNRALATVPNDKLGVVKAILARLGIPVRDQLKG